MSKVIPPWLLPKEVKEEKPELRPEDALLWEYARRYTGELGWSLCLLRPNSKLPQIQAWNDPLRVINTPDKAYLAIHQNPGCGFGVVHNHSCTGTGDVDHTDWTRLVFAEFGLDYDTLFDAFPRIRSRMGKDKILFRMPPGWEDSWPSKIKLTWPDDSGECDARGNPKLITVFELRAGPNQDVLPPSIHPDTQQPYEWIKAPWEFPQGIPDAPKELIAIWQAWDKSFKRQFEQACPWLPQEARELPMPLVTRQVGGQHNNLIGKFNERFDCITLIERNGYQRKGKRWLSPSSSTNVPGVVVLGDRVYSHHASDAISDGHAHDAFSLFTILEHHGDLNQALKAAARELGMSFGNSVKSANADISGFVESAKSGKLAKPTKKPEISKPAEYAFPDYLLNVPGLVGEIAGYINRTALFPQPVLALAASLSFCGALMGRKVCSETNLRTNIYTIGVAPSGSGKEHARKAIKQLVVAGNCEYFVGAEKLASDQGLFAMLHQSPSCVALMDEFGRTLRVMNNDRAPPHLAQLLTTIMELTGSADSYIMEKRRAEHSAKNNPLTIRHPNFCIYATTVPGRLYQGLTPDEVTDGFLPRFLVFESHTPDPEEQELTHAPIPMDLLTKIDYWSKKTLEQQGEGNMSFQPQMISMDAHAKALLKEKAQSWRKLKVDTRGSGLDALWARAYEHAMRLGLIRAAGIGDEMTEADIGWGCAMVDFLLQRMADQALANLATNEHEKHMQRVSAYLHEVGHCTLEQLTRKFRWLKQKERDGILSSLMDENRVDVESIKTTGRPKLSIHWLG